MAKQIIELGQAEDQYRDLLDETYPMIQFGQLSYTPSQVLYALDEVAYDLGFDDYVDSLANDGIYVEGLTDDLIEDEEDEDN